jgi:hypothetical protein
VSVDPAEVGRRLFGRAGPALPFDRDPALAAEVRARLEAFLPGRVELREDGAGFRVRLDGGRLEVAAEGATAPEALCRAALQFADALGRRPLTAAESRRLAERRGYSFSLVGAAPDRIRVELLCLAREPLPALTLGLRAMDGPVARDLALATAGQQPGRALVHEVRIEDPGLRATALEVFPLPTPGPGDRLRFLELAPLDPELLGAK